MLVTQLSATAGKAAMRDVNRRQISVIALRTATGRPAAPTNVPVAAAGPRFVPSASAANGTIA
jgi:hypothetical protein